MNKDKHIANAILMRMQTGFLVGVLFASSAVANPLIINHTQSLAASCAACHGTNGNSVGNAAKLAGLNADYFVAQMLAFKSGARKATVMHRHASGLTEAEINELAAYFASQVTKTPAQLKSQPLLKTTAFE